MVLGCVTKVILIIITIVINFNNYYSRYDYKVKVMEPEYFKGVYYLDSHLKLNCI